MALYDPLNGVYRKVTKSYDPVEGTHRKVTKAYDDVNGVYRQYFSSDPTAGGLAVGDSIWLSVNGAPREFLVVHQGNPDPALYDESCYGTWLLAKDIPIRGYFDLDAYDAWGEVLLQKKSNNYRDASIRYRLETDFMGWLSSNVQSIIKQVKIPYAYHDSDSDEYKVASGSSGVSTKIFLLSGIEVGGYGSDQQEYRTDGATLDYFRGTDNQRRIANYNSASEFWWLRSAMTKLDTDYHIYPYVWVVTKDGSLNYHHCTANDGIRPAFILDRDTPIDQSTGKNIIE